MHKTIVESIKYVIENSIMAKHCEVILHPQKTQGFWTMDVLTDKKYILKHIELVALHIGRMNGEGLWITKGRHKKFRYVFEINIG